MPGARAVRWKPHRLPEPAARGPRQRCFRVMSAAVLLRYSFHVLQEHIGRAIRQILRWFPPNEERLNEIQLDTRSPFETCA